MARNINLIGCTNVRVNPDVENLIAIDCHDQTFDSSYSNTTVLKNGTVVLTDDGFSESVTRDSAFVTEARYRTYFCDSTSSAFDIDLVDYGRSMVFIKTAGANPITITPTVGNIDGGAFVTLTTPVEVFFDGANWHTK